MLPSLVRTALAAALLSAAASAQDLIGVGWSGQVVLVDSYTGTVTPLGTGAVGQNALARDGRGRLWSTQRSGSAPYVYDFTTIDSSTGASTFQFSGMDIRGWTGAGGNTLYAITLRTGSQLLTVDLASGAVTVIGATGFSSIQGLALHQRTLYGWDLSRGLVVIDPLTGAATDPFPTVGGPSGLQYLCSHSDGRLLAGGGSTTNSLYQVDTATGVATLIGPTSGASDLRGLEQFIGVATSYGQACNGAFGPASLSISGTLRANGTLVSTSANHTPGAPGILVLGISSTDWLGLPLPLLLDPLLGTNGCSLYASLDVQLAGSAGPIGPADLQFVLPIPAGAGDVTVFLQHACFEPVPGNMSWSDGAAVYVSF